MQKQRYDIAKKSEYYQDNKEVIDAKKKNI